MSALWGGLAKAFASGEDEKRQRQRLVDQLQLQVAKAQVDASEQQQQNRLRAAQEANLQSEVSTRAQKAEQDAAAQNGRVSYLQSMSQKNAMIPEEALRGIASDPQSFREMAELTPDKNPVMNSPEWRAAKDFEAKTTAKYRPAKDPSAPNPKTFQQALNLQSHRASDTVVRNAQQVAQSYQTLKSAASDPSAQSDVAFVYAYMKMLDPGSAVREGEYATAANAAGVPEKVRLAYSRALSGQGLSPEQRAGFLKQATSLAKGQHQLLVNKNKYYSDIATRHGIDPNDVVDDPFLFDDPPKTATDPAARAAALKAKWGG